MQGRRRVRRIPDGHAFKTNFSPASAEFDRACVHLRGFVHERKTPLGGDQPIDQPPTQRGANSGQFFLALGNFRELAGQWLGGMTGPARPAMGLQRYQTGPLASRAIISPRPAEGGGKRLEVREQWEQWEQQDRKPRDRPLARLAAVPIGEAVRWEQWEQGKPNFEAGNCARLWPPLPAAQPGAGACDDRRG